MKFTYDIIPLARCCHRAKGTFKIDDDDGCVARKVRLKI